MIQSSTRNMGESGACGHFTLNTTDLLLASYIVNYELKTVKLGEDILIIAKSVYSYHTFLIK